jgi:hypothetical protein
MIYDLHDEKASPLFLTLTRCSKKEDLRCIKNDNGTNFVSDEERVTHIVNFFAKIYKKKPQATPIDYTSCIEDFLGQEVLNNPVVINSRITVQEKELLDRPLSITELDESLLQCNLRSAPGADGFSNKLIKKCWQYLRLPLFNYSNHCFASGILTTNFRSASIKLIQKKEILLS